MFFWLGGGRWIFFLMIMFDNIIEKNKKKCLLILIIIIIGRMNILKAVVYIFLICDLYLYENYFELIKCGIVE